jgi:dihydrofolate synthase / folylpolyglutamate synthase
MSPSRRSTRRQPPAAGYQPPAARQRQSGSRQPLAAHGGSAGAGRAPSPLVARAERQLRSLELFGMRFGLDRMWRMMTALGSPQRSFDSIHVVGTNGKSSTTQMIAAILRRHGMRTGSYTSPHLSSYCERIQVDGRQLDDERFAAAVARAVWAAERVNRTLAEDDHVTQFELLTAAALWQMAEAGVQVAVVEAGLGGRYDATSVIEAPITVLTNVGLEHTRWLGPTVTDIAGEKLAVVRPGGTLVLDRQLDGQARIVAERVARERRARIADIPGAGVGRRRDAGRDPRAVDARAIRPAARGLFQRRNFALAWRAAGEHLRHAGIELDRRAVLDAAAGMTIAGRLDVVDERPLTVLDGAHNPHAARALVDSLEPILRGRRLGLVMGVLDDKDATQMLALLLGRCERAWFTAPPSARSLSPATLQSLARQRGFARAMTEPRPARALALARRWASADVRGRAVLATGSIYLVGELLAVLRERRP